MPAKDQDVPFIHEIDYSDLEILRISLAEFPPGSHRYKVHFRVWYRTDYEGDFKAGKAGFSLHIETFKSLAGQFPTIAKHLLAVARKLKLEEI